MKLKAKLPEPIGFQLAPMLDVVFLLLIFFVVTQKFILNEQDLKVKVPTAPKSTEETSRAIDEIIINAREEDGELVITIDREVFTREKLSALMKRMVAVNPNQPVRIRGDADMSWQKMADVISTCSQAGVWNVSFSKQMPKEQQ
ncbi:MAG: biopolymer transporter ExbD [Akkermansia sp.]|nr:biopolymer transporter ExbD [Akkermansiaceae bacterium]MBQ3144783.1 biopolymer transporter ExbD [Akkermansia sp.]